MGDFSGIDPAAMLGMIKSFTSDKDDLRSTASSLKSQFDQYGLDSSGLNEIVGICGWLDDQLPMLKRRQGLAAGMDHDPNSQTMVNIPEPVITSAAAQADGKALAQQVNANESGDAKAAANYHAIALELAAHKDDPDFCSAFYANLDPVIATTLPSRMASTGSTTAADDLKIYSHAFGTAVSATYPAPGFDKIKQLYLKPLPKGTNGAGWNRAAMMTYGDFPPDFLAQATRANILDQFAKDPHADYRGPQDAASALGLPQDTVALNLQALSTNGRAAFDAIAQMGDPANPDLKGHLSELMEYGKWQPDVQTQLGAVIDNASGVHGSIGKDGQWHVDPSYKPDNYEQVFGFDAILAAAHTKDTLGFNRLFKQDMGRLAATYAPEMATAGNLANGYADQESSFGAPGSSTYKELPGITPSFYLSPGDAYLFMKTFADDDSMSAPYDEAMGDLQHRVLVNAARLDHDALLANTLGGGEHFTNATKAFGNVARLEYDALSNVRGDLDKQEEAFREHLKQGILLPWEVVGEPELGYGATLAWRTGMWATKEFGLTSAIDFTAPPERMEGVNEQNMEMLESSRYVTTQALIEGGWPIKDLPEELKDKDGNLKPFDQLSDSKDPKTAEEERKERLGQFDRWLADQDLPLGTATFHGEEEAGSGLLTTIQVDAIVKDAEGKKD